MDNRIQEAFQEIHAEEELKNSTRAFLAQKTNGYSRQKIMWHPRPVFAVICLLFLLFGSGGYGYWVYFTPTAVISVDINPSFELGINRFDKVVSVNGYNDDGKKLASSLDIKFMNYTQAMDKILGIKSIADLYSQEEELVITVVGQEGEQRTRMVANMEACAARHENTYCYSADSEEITEAHDTGLSCGKYRAYLELQALNPDITPEDVQNMTMREICDMINALSEDVDTNYEYQGTGNGQGNGYGNGQGNGYGNGHGHGHGHGHGGD